MDSLLGLTRQKEKATPGCEVNNPLGYGPNDHVCFANNLNTRALNLKSCFACKALPRLASLLALWPVKLAQSCFSALFPFSLVRLGGSFGPSCSAFADHGHTDASDGLPMQGSRLPTSSTKSLPGIPGLGGAVTRGMATRWCAGGYGYIQTRSKPGGAGTSYFARLLVPWYHGWSIN